MCELPQVLPWSLPEGQLLLYPGFVTASESEALQAHWLQCLPWDQPHIRLYGRSVAIPRRQVWMGDEHARYRYSATDFVPWPWEERARRMRDRIAALCARDFNSVLFNHYRDGRDSMGWHSDDEPELGAQPVIASLSLGASRRFLLAHRRRDLKIEMVLHDGDLLLMSGLTQECWRHAVPREARVTQARMNLTFRTIRPGGPLPTAR